MGTVAHRPQDLYAEIKGVPPDLICIFGELRWRSVGSLGADSVYTFENDTGPDDANHAQEGLYVVCHSSLEPRGCHDDANLYDVAPTILKMLSLPVPPHMRGRSLM